MATGGTYNDHEFLFRLQTLIIDGGTVVVRTVFDQKLSNVPLNVFLLDTKTAINHLRGQKTITQKQYDLLYPPNGQLPSSADFDITLLICLLRNLQSFGLNRNFSWNIPPQLEDTSVEADLCRLLGFQNEVANISSTTIQQTYFQTKWTEIEQVLLRLNSAVPYPDQNLQQTFDSYKNSPFNSAAANRTQANIQKWREMERGLDTEMQLMRKDVKELEQHLTEEVGACNKSAAEVKMDIGEIKKNPKNVNLMPEASNVVKGDENSILQDLIKYNSITNLLILFFVSSRDESCLCKEGPHTTAVQTPILSEDQAYHQMITDLQGDLIEFYRCQHTTISLSPLIKEATPLLEFYVMPDIKSVTFTRARGGGKEEKVLVAPFHNVFYKENKMCHEIYLSADAGLGKTAFSKRLALTWCHAKKPLINENRVFLSQEEIETMNGFRFVFLVLLRDSSNECDIDELISNQIISKLAHTYTSKDLEKILFKETCLLILDGLDEWTHPPYPCRPGPSSIPHRKVRKCLTVLTTTRPWKLSVIGLHSNQIDKKLEITGLNQESESMLKKSVISHLLNEKDEWKLEEQAIKFTRAMEEKHISGLEAIPLLLMDLLLLWYYKMDLGQSQCELYSHITELLLSRTASKFKNIPSQSKHAQGEIPCCLSKLEHCRQYYPLLKALGQIAFLTLFGETKEENRHVFDSSVAQQYLNKESLTFCLRTGIITQSKVQGQLLEQKRNISFAHKTVQEFFAAVYMFSIPDQTSVSEIVLSKCKCVKDILEISKILLFISGINVNLSSLISRKLMRIINGDEVTRKYRRTSNSSSYIYENLLKEFQDTCILCCKEFPHENEVNFCLQDVFIDDSCQQEQYRKNLKQLTTRNKQNIRSLYINMDNMHYIPCNSAQEVINYFALHDLENIEKIFFDGEYNAHDILPLLNKTVKSLSLVSNLQDLPQGSWSPSLLRKVTSLQKLEAINISEVDMSHSELTLLSHYISQRHCMQEIVLRNLGCADHRESCTGCSIDLSQHSQLRELTLGGTFCLSELNINMALLERCILWNLSKPDLVLRFVNCVPADSKLNTFVCDSLESSAAIETMLETLRLLVHVKYIELLRINLGNRNLPLSSEMVDIETVALLGVTLSASVFRGLIASLHKLPQTVRVDMQLCDITPKREFETEKEKIKTSPYFRVLRDDSRSRFQFETIRGGDKVPNIFTV